MSKRTHGSIAYGAAAMIRSFWNNHPERAKFYTPRVEVASETFEIKSNMKNGYPPKIHAAVRSM